MTVVLLTGFSVTSALVGINNLTLEGQTVNIYTGTLITALPLSDFQYHGLVGSLT